MSSLESLTMTRVYTIRPPSSLQLHLPLTHAELGPQSAVSEHGEPLAFA